VQLKFGVLNNEVKVSTEGGSTMVQSESEPLSDCTTIGDIIRFRNSMGSLADGLLLQKWKYMWEIPGDILYFCNKWYVNKIL
jgi:hypothetical protein